MTLSLLFHIWVDGTDGIEDDVSELVSSASYSDMIDGVEGTIGAARKCIPRGVGKWSLMGDNHCSIFSIDFVLFLLVRSEMVRSGTMWDTAMVIIISSLSSSIIGLRALAFLRPAGEEGRYVVAGKRIRSAIVMYSSSQFWFGCTRFVQNRPDL
jgi:hypothetical protein